MDAPRARGSGRLCHSFADLGRKRRAVLTTGVYRGGGGSAGGGPGPGGEEDRRADVRTRSSRRALGDVRGSFAQERERPVQVIGGGPETEEGSLRGGTVAGGGRPG